MSYQFVHMDTHALSVSSLRRQYERAASNAGVPGERRLSIDEIAAEAARLPGNHPHIVEPHPPILRYGIAPDDVPAYVRAKFDEAQKATRARKAAMPRGTRSKGPRGPRKDAHALLTIVSSYPVPWMNENGGPSLQDPIERASYDAWVQQTTVQMQMVAERQGLKLLCVVEHTDERFGHLHGLFVSENGNPDVRALHPGHAAARAVKSLLGEETGDTKARGNTAYKAAMVSFQDDWHEFVSCDYALERLGPARERRTREAHREIERTRRARIESENTHRTNVAAVEQRCASFEKGETEIIDRLVAMSSEHQSFEDKAKQAKQEAAVAEAKVEAARAAQREADAATIAALGAKAQIESQILVLQRNVELEGSRLTTQLQQRVDQERQMGDISQRLATMAAQADEEEKRAARASEDIVAKQRQFKMFEADRRSLLDADRAELEVRRGALARDREELKTQRAAVDARMEGVDLYFKSHIGVTDKGLTAVRAVVPVEVIQRLGPQSAWLLQSLRPLVAARNAEADKASARINALVAAVNGWATGHLLGILRHENGQTILDILNHPSSMGLKEKLESFRMEIADLISILPDRSLIWETSILAKTLQPILAGRHFEHSQQLIRMEELLRNHGREGR